LITIGVDIHIVARRISLKLSKFKRRKRGTRSRAACIVGSHALQASYPLNEKPHHTNFSCKVFVTAVAYFFINKTRRIKVKCFCPGRATRRRITTVMKQMRNSRQTVKTLNSKRVVQNLSKVWRNAKRPKKSGKKERKARPNHLIIYMWWWAGFPLELRDYLGIDK
jgi:hypothetical protein